MGSLPAVLADTAPPIMVIDQQCRGQWQCHADAHGWHLPVSPRTHGGEGTGDHAQHHRGIGMPVGLGGGGTGTAPTAEASGTPPCTWVWGAAGSPRDPSGGAAGPPPPRLAHGAGVQGWVWVRVEVRAGVQDWHPGLGSGIGMWG